MSTRASSIPKRHRKRLRSRIVIAIAPLATVFAFMAGITLGLPAGYVGRSFDTVLSFTANLILAFPVILLFYLLVTPEISQTGLPQYLGLVLFLFPIIFLCILLNSRFHVKPQFRNIVIAAVIVIGGWAYLSLVSEPGTKVAILLSDDRKEVLTGREGDTVANRLRIVRIGIESVEVQDLGSDRVRRIPLKGN